MKIEDAIKTSSGMAAELGRIMLEIGKISPRAQTLFEQDLDNPEMGLDKLKEALYTRAGELQEQGAWGCAVFGIDPENPVIQVILDFYHVPPEWLGGAAPKPQALGAGSLLDLL